MLVYLDLDWVKLLDRVGSQKYSLLFLNRFSLVISNFNPFSSLDNKRNILDRLRYHHLGWTTDFWQLDVNESYQFNIFDFCQTGYVVIIYCFSSFIAHNLTLRSYQSSFWSVIGLIVSLGSIVLLLKSVDSFSLCQDSFSYAFWI